MVLDDEALMARALGLARKSYHEGGCPIGAVLADSGSGVVLGQGHNCLIQDGNPIVHGEMAAIRDAGRMKNRHHATMYTTLQPCFMCAGMLVQFGIRRVVIGDVMNAASPETIEFLRSKGVDVTVLDQTNSSAARGCIALSAKFRVERPDLWLEDWGGGPNPLLPASPPNS
ncbi:MAG TPA: nucleoside deaminase [Caldimonas sp.]